MKIRNFIVVGLLALVFVLSPVIINAQTLPPGGGGGTTCDLSLMICQLEKQMLQLKIGSLQQQINQLNMPCQQPGAIYNFQTGNVCATNATTTPSITVISPNGGEGWQIGTKQAIIWSAENVPANNVVNIGLVSYAPPGVPSAYYTLLLNLPSDWRGASWIVGEDSKGNKITAGTYYMSVCLGNSDTGGEICDRSNSPFKIYDSATTNRPPSISGVSGPTTLDLWKSGTWTVQASDPENKPLSYSVKWGDEVTTGTTAGSPPTGGVQQTATFTHTYSKAGTYSPTFTVTDNSGQSAKTSLSVMVGGTQPPQPIPTIISSYPPNGAIDARGYTTDPNVSGFKDVTLYLSQMLDSLNSSDFSVSSSNSGSAPSVMVYLAPDRQGMRTNQAVASLSRSLNAGERIRITHKPSNSSVCLGFLPGDVNQDGRFTSTDIAGLRSLVGTADGATKPLWQTDINRDGVFNQTDVTRAGELLSDPSAIKTLPACPPPTGGLGLTTRQSQIANALASLRSLLEQLQVLKQSSPR